MGYFFQKNPQRYPQWNPVRRMAPWGRGVIPQITMHSYEAPYTRSLLAAATYLLTRTTPGSYHTIAGAKSDRDILQLAPVSAETWHSIPSNKWAIGISAVAYAHQWTSIPTWARDNLVKSLAYAAYLASLELIALGSQPVPAKLISRAEAMRGVWGFVDHMRMDPARRTDIGITFPWGEFFAEYTRLLGGAAPAPSTPTTPIAPEEDEMAYFVKAADTGKVYITNGIVKQYITTPYVLEELKKLTGNPPTVTLGQFAVDRIPDAEVKIPAGINAGDVRSAVTEALEQLPEADELDADAIAESVATRLAGGLEIGLTVTGKPSTEKQEG